MKEDISSLTIAHLKPDMILADDAVNKLGVLILPKDTVLDKETFLRLRKNNVISVKVYSDSINENNSLFIDLYEQKSNKIAVDTSNPDKNKPEFKKFRITFRQKMNELKECIDMINSTENNVKPEQLIHITDSIMQTVNCRSDLINYMSYLMKMDDYTYSHSINVSILCNIFGCYVGLEKEEIDDLIVAGLLHDIGKTKLSPSILKNERNLKPQEFNMFKEYPKLSYNNVMQNRDINDRVKEAILTHREYIDGSGFPEGLKDNEISIYGKILGICDAYDTKISVYGLCPFDVIKNFKNDYIGLFDTKYLLTFIEFIMYTYVGSYVTLSDNKTGLVMYINPENLSRPIIKIGDKAIDLANETDLYIKSMA